jgi:RNA-binding protein 39
MQKLSTRSTVYVLIKNAFDPREYPLHTTLTSSETDPDWDKEIEQDVREECMKFGQVLHIHLDRDSKGYIYLKFDTVEASNKCTSVLNGRYFSGRQVYLLLFML